MSVSQLTELAAHSVMQTVMSTAMGCSCAWLPRPAKGATDWRQVGCGGPRWAVWLLCCLQPQSSKGPLVWLRIIRHCLRRARACSWPQLKLESKMAPRRLAAGAGNGQQPQHSVHISSLPPELLLVAFQHCELEHCER